MRLFSFKDYVLVREGNDQIGAVYQYISKLSQDISSKGTNDNFIKNETVRKFVDHIFYMILRDLIPKIQSTQDPDEKIMELEKYKKVVQKEWDKIPHEESGEMNIVDRMLGQIWDKISKAV